jgi:hypothetical protein
MEVVSFIPGIVFTAQSSLACTLCSSSKVYSMQSPLRDQIAMAVSYSIHTRVMNRCCQSINTMGYKWGL